jgi:peptide/nickel transport system ATP-binding protein
MALLEVEQLRVAFATPRGLLKAVDGVDLALEAGETLGLVGESGCGKSTLAKAIMRLVPISGGAVRVEGEDITTLEGAALRRIRPKLQMVFQDPYGSLNPRRRVGTLVAQPLTLAGWKTRDARARVAELLAQVGLPTEAAERYPHEFSGGQRQRIGIARALALSPKVLILDEPVSALDVSVRAQVINLLQNLQARLGVAYLFVSHDLTVVEHVADRLLVMYLGRVVERGPAEALWRRPAHPYTQALLSAAPIADPVLARRRKRIVLQGDLPSPVDPPSGCAFRTRCRFAVARCAAETPLLRPVGAGQDVACHFDLAEEGAVT